MTGSVVGHSAEQNMRQAPHQAALRCAILLVPVRHPVPPDPEVAVPNIATELPRAEVVAAGLSFDLPSLPVHNPALVDEIVGLVSVADECVVDAVVLGAHHAGRAWGELSMAERAGHLRAAAAALTAGPANSTAERARLLTREQGKVLWESEVDLGGAAHLLRYYADLIEPLDDEEVTIDKRGTTIVRRLPIGVTALIVPWNYPIYLCFMGLAPALAAGNAVVVKPSELAPLALTQTLEIVSQALPPGVLNVVTGSGETGSALVRHPLVRKVVFTGGTATGRSVLRDAAEGITSVSLELGGNDPALVLGSASLSDEMMSEIRRSVFTCSGQVCFNIKRIYVARSLHDEFVSRLRDAVDEIVVGDGLDPHSTIGPLNNARQFASVTELRALTEASGARVDVLGRALHPQSWQHGYFMRPVVVTDIAADAPLVVREQFGPIVPVLAYDNLDDAVRWANDSEYGLAASVWSDDIDEALVAARRIEAGSVFVNSHRVGSTDMTMPFGGLKQSGLGRNHGRWAIDECSELQAIAHRPDTRSFPGTR